MSNETEGNFRAAVQKLPIFISNVHKATSEKDIVEYIHKKTHEWVSLEKITMKKKMEHNAFKFFVAKSKLSSYLDDQMWPQGIIFRRFIHFKYKEIDGGKSENGPRTN